MERARYKVELESLQWLGMHYLTNWLVTLMDGHEEQMGGGGVTDKEGGRNEGEESSSYSSFSSSYSKHII